MPAGQWEDAMALSKQERERVIRAEFERRNAGQPPLVPKQSTKTTPPCRRDDSLAPHHGRA
jgi:hypothetical protein